MKRGVMAVCLSLFAAGALRAAAPAARWDVIPYQRVSGSFAAGVVAFHESGVTVTFSVNGKKAFVASEPTLNARTGVREYVFPLDASKYPDGKLVLGAVAEARGGSSRTLPDLTLYADARKTQGSRKVAFVDPANGNEFQDGTRASPVKTIRQGLRKAGDGGTVYLLAGDYSLKMLGGGLKRSFWTTVTPAPGVDRSQVKVGAGRPGTEKLRFVGLDLSIDTMAGYDSIVKGENGKTMAWFDGCTFSNAQGRWGGEVSPFGNGLRAFVTGGETFSTARGPFAEIVRGHTVREIASDAFLGENSLVVNCRVEGIDPGTTGAMPDFFRMKAPPGKWAGDAILYGVEGTDCKCRLFSGQRCRDVAVVDVSIEATGGDLLHSQFMNEAENLLFANVSTEGQDWQWMKAKNKKINFAPKDVRLFNVKTKGFDGYEPVDGTGGLLIADRPGLFGRED